MSIYNPEFEKLVSDFAERAVAFLQTPGIAQTGSSAWDVTLKVQAEAFRKWPVTVTLMHGDKVKFRVTTHKPLPQIAPVGYDKKVRVQ